MNAKWKKRGRADRRVAGDDEGPFVHPLERGSLHDVVGRTRRGDVPLMQKHDVVSEAGDEIELMTH